MHLRHRYLHFNKCNYMYQTYIIGRKTPLNKQIHGYSTMPFSVECISCN